MICQSTQQVQKFDTRWDDETHWSEIKNHHANISSKPPNWGRNWPTQQQRWRLLTFREERCQVVSSLCCGGVLQHLLHAGKVKHRRLPLVNWPMALNVEPKNWISHQKKHFTVHLVLTVFPSNVRISTGFLAPLDLSTFSCSLLPISSVDFVKSTSPLRLKWRKKSWAPVGAHCKPKAEIHTTHTHNIFKWQKRCLKRLAKHPQAFPPYERSPRRAYLFQGDSDCPRK